MTVFFHETGFADTLPAHHVITNYNAGETITDAHLWAHVVCTTRSGMVNHRGWRQQVIDRLVTAFILLRGNRP